MFKTIIEPFKIKSVEPINMTTGEERKKFLADAGYNVFNLHSDQVLIDLLTDSGTSAMSAAQWAGMMVGDEAYAGSKSWFRMEGAIKDLTGMPYVLPTHQGRAAERILYGYLGGPGKIFISNTHFDTTRANIEFAGAEAIDIPVEEGRHPDKWHPFKGNMDIEKLKELIRIHSAPKIAAVILTVTNNSGGGQPVSMANALEIHHICKENGILFLLDACRIAENAYFIHTREQGFSSVSFRKIAQDMFKLADGAVMSAKKDALVNMGGFLALHNSEVAEACRNLLILSEGFSTYGGLSGREMEAIATGLEEVFDPHYLHYRIRSTAYLGEKLYNMGIPVVWPIGGHAVYIDARAFYPLIPVDEYPGQMLVSQLYLKGGIRAVETGSVMFGKYDAEGHLIPAPLDLVRLAIPRRVYTQSHIEYVIEVFEKLLQDRKLEHGFKITYEPRYLRHFSARFAPVTESAELVI